MDMGEWRHITYYCITRDSWCVFYAKAGYVAGFVVGTFEEKELADSECLRLNLAIKNGGKGMDKIKVAE